MTVEIDRIREVIASSDPRPAHGRISRAVGLVLEGYAPACAIGDVCEIRSRPQGPSIRAEVVGFRDDKALLMPLGDLTDIGPGSLVVDTGEPPTVAVGDGLLGRVIDGLGRPLDGRPPMVPQAAYRLHATPPNPMRRRRISAPLDLGIRAINGLLTCGRGQRVGVFAGSGVGKSVLLGMMARYTAADVTVIALVGERGREVRDFIDKNLGLEGLRRSVVVVATSDQPSLVRVRGALTAMAIAEFFRDQGRHVLLMMDSLTRLAHAQREIGLASGEPPTTKGYTPSVFALLPRFLERAGTADGSGTITGLFTVLVEGDDLTDPIPDAARAILDGHIILSRELAAQNQYPAIDLLRSASRVMIDVVEARQLDDARRLAELLAAYDRAKELIQIGAYKPGSDPAVDRALAKWDRIRAYFHQGMDQRVDLATSAQDLARLVEN
ncbi:MAG: FliI/YscN family ATPase [Nitrospirota bacterium]